jgi:methenyltetrahydrofolate cyclohydrolase
MDIPSLPIDEFLRRLASSDPVPGGGSLSALTGAMAAAQLAMVCNLTVGRPRFAEVEAQVQDILRQVDALQQQLAALATKDTEVYAGVRDAYGLPRGTDEEKVARLAAIQQAMRPATEVPVQTAEAARATLDQSVPAAETTNPSTLGDVAVAAHIAFAATHAAAVQAELNLGSLTDAEFASNMRTRVEQARAGAETVRDRAVAIVRQRAAG